MTFPKGTDFGLTDKSGLPLTIGDRFYFRGSISNELYTGDWIGEIAWIPEGYQLGFIKDGVTYPLSTFNTSIADVRHSIQNNFQYYIIKEVNGEFW